MIFLIPSCRWDQRIAWSWALPPTTSRWHNTRFSWCGVKAQLLLLKCHARHRGCHHDAVWPCTTESIIYRRDQKGIVGDDAVVACDLLNYLDSWYFVIVWQYICGNIAIVPTTSTLCRLLSERGYHGSAVFLNLGGGTSCKGQCWDSKFKKCGAFQNLWSLYKKCKSKKFHAF